MDITKLKKILTTLPDNPGIYLFYNKQGALVYVGKATSLKDRVRSYFRPITITTRPIEDMIHEVANIKWKETDSVLEAVIVEAIYIKKFWPKYNVLGKDNKSWNYIVVTNDEFPKVLTIRQHEYTVLKKMDPAQIEKFTHIFGPYPGLNTKAAMKLLRQIFHFSNCNPPSTTMAKGISRLRLGFARNDKSPRPCLYFEMGQCPGICAGVITAAEYKQKVITPLITFLQGKKKQVVRLFEKEMERAGKAERFEEAARIRDQLDSLYRIQDIALLNKSFVTDIPSRKEMVDYIARERHPSEWQDREVFGGRSLKRFPRFSEEWQEGTMPYDGNIRIEGYDISNIGATQKVGSMVVFNEYGPVKREYRKFIIRRVAGQSDVDCLAEMLERRLRHVEWPLPAVFLIDGGRPQVNRVVETLSSFAQATADKHAMPLWTIPVVGIAKGPERKRNDFILGNKDPRFIQWVDEHKELLIQTRDEAHRFAIAFHRKRRSRQFLPR